MRIKELNEKFGDSFKAGYQAPLIGKGALGGAGQTSGSAAPAAKTTGSPFDLLSRDEAKVVLDNIINGKALTDNQIYKLKQIYRKL